MKIVQHEVWTVCKINYGGDLAALDFQKKSIYCEVLLVLTLINIRKITVGTIHQTLNSG